MNKENAHTEDSKLQARIKTIEKQDQHIELFFHQTLHWIERIIAMITLVVLIGALSLELYNGFTGYLKDINTYLHTILTIVVGLEFVRMLIDTTYDSILEVLTVAITRHVLLTHDTWSNVACVACIAVLFLTRRYLVRRNEQKKESEETE